MKRPVQIICGIIFLAALLGLNVCAASAPAGYMDFGSFAPPASGEFVEVNVNSNLLAMTCRLLQKQEPEMAELLGKLQHVRVNVLGLDEKNRAEIVQRITAIQNNLETQQWQRVVMVQQKDEDVRVYMRTRGGEAVEGAVVTVIDGGKQAVLVNIVGDIKPEEIALIGERFNIDPLKKMKPKSGS